MDDAWPAARTERNEQLLRAAAAGDAAQCKQLLEYKNDDGGAWDGSADAWYADEALGWDALHYAADACSAVTVRVLLRYGGLWNAVDRLGYTAGDLAWSRNATECYMLLLEGA